MINLQFVRDQLTTPTHWQRLYNLHDPLVAPIRWQCIQPALPTGYPTFLSCVHATCVTLFFRFLVSG